MRRCFSVLIALFAAVSLCQPCLAASRHFVASATNPETGSSLKAEALFELEGDLLKVTLSNTSMQDVLRNPDILTAVLFDIGGNPILTKKSAQLAPGSTVYHSRLSPHPTDVGGEWAYRGDLSAPGVGRYGISSSGLDDLFGPPHRFGTTNLFGPRSPGGLDYGLTSLGDNPSTGTGLVGPGGWPIIHGSVIFTFQVNPEQFILEAIQNVQFQYGTSLCQELRFLGEPAPEPTTLGVLGLGAASLLARRLRRRSRPQAGPDWHASCRGEDVANDGAGV